MATWPARPDAAFRVRVPMRRRRRHNSMTLLQEKERNQITSLFRARSRRENPRNQKEMVDGGEGAGESGCSLRTDGQRKANGERDGNRIDSIQTLCQVSYSAAHLRQYAIQARGYYLCCSHYIIARVPWRVRAHGCSTVKDRNGRRSARIRMRRIACSAA